MGEYHVIGGNKISGELTINGGKNAVLPILASVILNSAESVIHKCPQISDTFVSIEILKALGCKIKMEGNTLTVNSKTADCFEVPEQLVREMRSSIIFLGGILGRFKKVVIGYPGGCDNFWRHKNAVEYIDFEFAKRYTETRFSISWSSRRDSVFVGRTTELEALNNLYKSDRFECPVIYGRRRVGKTTLINEFCKDKKAIYFVAIESTMQNNLENLSKNIFAVTMPNFETMPSFDKLDKLLDYLYDVSKDERVILVIDEYPYLANADHSVSSVLQSYIDHKFKDSKLFLILCGSSMSFMENQVLGYKSPLFGRRTAQFKIKPFDYYTSAEFCPQYSNEDKAVLYGVTGGIPHYLARIDPKKSIKENIIENFFNPAGYFFEEPANLLKQELREPQIYNAIIEAVAKGASKLNEIATAVGLETGLCATYIKSLISLGIMEKEKPIGEDNSKKTIYRITDNMFRFWYRFIPNNMTAIVSGNGANVYEKVVFPHLNEYMGNVFEQIAIQYLIRMNNSNQLPFMFFNIGRWWGNNPAKKSQAEIDIVAIAPEEKKILFGECKYRNEPVDTGVIDKLLENSELITGYGERYFYVFSRSGFSKNVLELDNGVMLVDLQGMF